jgi:hypothetical protein
MPDWVHEYAGRSAANPDWTFGLASAALSREYDPQGYQDIYYLLDASGRITYVNGAPASTMPQLLAEAAKVGNQA